MPGALKRVGDWLDERTGYRRVLSTALDEPVRGGASWAYVFGSVLTFVLLLQVVTGILLAMTYSPSAQTAWASVAYIQDQVTLGWFIRGLHSTGASAMVIVAGFHLLQVTVYGAYKRPREVNWLVGAVMLALILAFALTGYLLPWDQKGYWATKVATGIMGSTPVVGGWLQSLLQGGNEYGNLTLTRFYAIHVFLLPAAIGLLVAMHIALFRKHGVTPRWRKEGQPERPTQPFWPDQLLRDMVAIGICFVVMGWWVLRSHGAELGAPADPASSYDARPEWYFLPLFQLLKYFHGIWEKVAAFGTPAVVGFVLVGLPFLDRGPDRSPSKRAPFLGAVAALFVGAGVLIVLAVQGDADDAGYQKRHAEAEAQAQHARQLALQGVPPPGGTAVYQNEPFYKGKKLFGERCSGCHQGKDRKGPELTSGYGSRAWLRAYLGDPDASRFFGATKGIHKMKPTQYTGAELDAVVEMLYAESGAADAKPDLVAQGQKIFDNGPCQDCHARDGTTSDDEGPNLGGRGTAAWVAAMITDPTAGRLFGAKNEMTVGAKLSPDEILRIAEYVASLRDEASSSDAKDVVLEKP